MPIPLSFTLLTLLLPFTTAQTLLEFVDNVVSTNLDIPLNETKTHRLDLPSVDATLRLEWTSLNQTAFPSTLFYLSETSDFPIKFSGESLDHNPRAANHTCNVTQPCATVSTIDFEAFYTRSPHSFLRLPFSETDKKTIFVTVFNYEIPSSAPIPPSPPTLTGVLTARIVQQSADCPAGTFSPHHLCNSRGTCDKSRCQCEQGYAGTACQTRVISLPSINKPPNETLLAQPSPDSYSARINLFTGVVFSAKKRNPGTALLFRILLLRAGNGDDNPQVPIVWLFSTPPQFGQPLLRDNVTLPTLANPPIAIPMIRGFFCPRDVQDEETVYLAFYALPTNVDMTDGYAIVNINQTETSPDQCQTRANSIPLGLALVPAFLVTTAVAATGVLVMVWLDCRHGFTNRVDRLSNEEIERMYPSTPYRGDTLECPICLSEIQPPQQIRNLKCSHVYHTECLDPWLTQNRASCPTCRTDVRVEQLSDKRHMRRIVQFFLAPFIYIRRLRERRRGPAPVDQSSPDLETGDTGDTLNPESNHRHENTTLNDPEPANDTSTIQPITVTPQSPATDISR